MWSGEILDRLLLVAVLLVPLGRAQDAQAPPDAEWVGRLPVLAGLGSGAESGAAVTVRDERGEPIALPLNYDPLAEASAAS